MPTHTNTKPHAARRTSKADRNSIAASVRAYDAKVDSKKRIVIRGASYDFYRVSEQQDGAILLTPKVLVDAHPVSKSQRTKQGKPPAQNLVAFFKKSPLKGVHLDTTRHKGTSREISF